MRFLRPWSSCGGQRALRQPGQRYSSQRSTGLDCIPRFENVSKNVWFLCTDDRQCYFMELRRKITVVFVPLLPENADRNETMTCHAPCVHKRRRFLFSNAHQVSPQSRETLWNYQNIFLKPVFSKMSEIKTSTKNRSDHASTIFFFLSVFVGARWHPLQDSCQQAFSSWTKYEQALDIPMWSPGLRQNELTQQPEEHHR